MRDDTTCNVLCQKTLTQRDVEAFQNAIDEEYHNWIVDNLPAAGISKAGESGALKTQYVKGFPIGYVAEDENGGVLAAAAHIKPSTTCTTTWSSSSSTTRSKRALRAPIATAWWASWQPRSAKRGSERRVERWKDDFMPYLTTCEVRRRPARGRCAVEQDGKGGRR